MNSKYRNHNYANFSIFQKYEREKNKTKQKTTGKKIKQKTNK